MRADVVVVGAGIAGVAVAHQLTARLGMTDVVLVDPRPPLTLTSDKSTECYRNWWPNRPMVGLMNRSIDLLEMFATESDNAFGLTRRGYLFVTGRTETVAAWENQANQTSRFGAGPVRSHPGPITYRPHKPEGFHDQPEGVDMLEGSETIRTHFPFITKDAVGALHVRRAGWFSAQQLGAWMLERAKKSGLIHIVDYVTSVSVSDDSITGVGLQSGGSVSCGAVVNTSGPMAGDIARMANLDLPLKSEVHLKVAFRDHRRVVPREAPMIIWSDPQQLKWSEEEREALAGAGRDDLLGEMPVFCHGRPEGGEESPYFLGLWEYHNDVREPTWPIPDDTLYPEVVLRGLSTMVPGFGAYLKGLPEATVDGGYYTKTPENRPLVGPAGPDGFYLACGYSGFGVMVAAGAADLLARHITGDDLPGYAPDFLLSRYKNPDYLASIADDVGSGQL